MGTDLRKTSSQRQQTPRDKISSQKFPRNDRLFVKVHRQILIHNCPIKKTDREKSEIRMGTRRREAHSTN